MQRFFKFNNRIIYAPHCQLGLSQFQVGFGATRVEPYCFLKRGDCLQPFPCAVERQTSKITDKKYCPQLSLGGRELGGSLFRSTHAQQHLSQANVTRRQRISSLHEIPKNGFCLLVSSSREVGRSEPQMQGVGFRISCKAI